MQTNQPAILGIDIGSVSIGIIQLTTDRQIVHSRYGFHFGDMAGTLVNLLSDFDLGQAFWVATGVGTPEIVQTSQRFDEQICCIAAARHYRPDVRTILNVGGV